MKYAFWTYRSEQRQDSRGNKKTSIQKKLANHKPMYNHHEYMVSKANIVYL